MGETGREIDEVEVEYVTMWIEIALEEIDCRHVHLTLFALCYPCIHRARYSSS
jgi:hypothetical protein